MPKNKEYIGLINELTDLIAWINEEKKVNPLLLSLEPDEIVSLYMKHKQKKLITEIMNDDAKDGI